MEAANQEKEIMKRLEIIKEFYDEAFVGLELNDNIFTVKWSPQYGECFLMYGALEENGEFFYGNSLDTMKSNEWFDVAEDITEGWTKEVTKKVKFGIV